MTKFYNNISAVSVVIVILFSIKVVQNEVGSILLWHMGLELEKKVSSKTELSTKARG